MQRILMHILKELGLDSPMDFQRLSGMFRGHPLGRLYDSEGWTDYNLAFCEPLLEDLVKCRQIAGIDLVRRDFRTTKFWSARLQIALARRLLDQGLKVELEVHVNKDGQIVKNLGDVKKLRDAGETATAIDIHLPDLAFDIEVYSRGRQFFRTFSPRHFEELGPPETILMSRGSASCFVTVNTLLPFDSNELANLASHIELGVGELLAGRVPGPSTILDDKVSIQFAWSAPLEVAWENMDLLKLTDRTFGAVIKDLRSELAKVEVDVYLCYRDATAMDRVVSDLQKSFDEKFKQLAKYPPGRSRVLAVELPHTLVRYAENEDEETRKAFRANLEDLVKRRVLTRLRKQTGVALEAMVLAEFGVVSSDGGGIKPSLYLYGVALDPAPNFDAYIEPMISATE